MNLLKIWENPLKLPANYHLKLSFLVKLQGPPAYKFTEENK